MSGLERGLFSQVRSPRRVCGKSGLDLCVSAVSASCLKIQIFTIPAICVNIKLKISADPHLKVTSHLKKYILWGFPITTRLFFLYNMYF